MIPSISPEEARALRAKARRKGRSPAEILNNELKETEFPLGSSLSPLQLLSDPQQLLGGGTGANLWHAAYLLVRHTGKMDPNLWEGKHVLELGAGLGVCGLALTRQHAPASLLLTDLEAQLPLLERNVANNRRAALDKISTSVLRFGEPLIPAVAAHCPFDIVIGSDIVYEESSSSSGLSGLLLTTLAEVCAPHTLVLLSLPHRGDGDEMEDMQCTAQKPSDYMKSTQDGLSTGFIKLASKRGWVIEELTLYRKCKSGLPYDIGLYKLQKQNHPPVAEIVELQGMD